MKGDLSSEFDLPQRRLDLLILKILNLEAQHGWGTSEKIRPVSRDVLQVQQVPLYPPLNRLECRGRIQAKPGVSDNTRRAKFYGLTPAGQRQLEDASAPRRKLPAAGEIVIETA